MDGGSTETLNREAKKREFQGAIEKESGHDASMGDDSMDGLDGPLSRGLQAIPKWNLFAEEKEFRTVECCGRSVVWESVELERGWIVGGLHGHFLVADFDVHRLGRFCYCKDVSENRMERTLELFTPSELLRGLRFLAVIAEMERTIEDCWWCSKMDCGRAGWMDS